MNLHIWNRVIWVPTGICTPPHRVTHEEKLEQLTTEFSQRGWDIAQPALVGYPLGCGIQLLSGSHRWAAATAAGLVCIPVIIHPYSAFQRAHGNLGAWKTLMDAPPTGSEEIR